jgi:mono/diheme cytochrome c family protein
MCLEFRFVFDQRSGCDKIAGTDSRRSAGPAFVSDELRAAMETMRAATRDPICIICTESDARIHEVIIAGIKGEMPSFGKKLGDSDVRQLIAYLRTLHG